MKYNRHSATDDFLFWSEYGPRFGQDFGGATTGKSALPSTSKSLSLLTSAIDVRFFDFVGGDGDDVWTGGISSDHAEGRGGDDQLSGVGGDDVLVGNEGGNTLDGGDGDDILYAGDESPAFGNPTYGSDPAPILDTGTDVDTLIGGDGDDRIFAGYGDNVDGGVETPHGADRLFISFLGASAGISYDGTLASQTIGGGTITGIESTDWIQGSNFDDYIYIGRESVQGDYGVIYGMDGNDTIFAGYYSGFVSGGLGDDIIDARGATPYLLHILGDDGNDTIYGQGNSLITIEGGGGNDTIYGSNNIHGGSGNDTIYVLPLSDNTAYGEDGNDTISVVQPLSVPARNCTLAGGAGDDVLIGGRGNDTLISANAGPNENRLDLGIEHDSIFGGEGNDTIWAGYGDDVDGGEGIDKLRLSLAGASAGVNLRTHPLTNGGSVTLGGGTIQNIERLVYVYGSNFDDRFVVATQADALDIRAGNGDDVVFADESTVRFLGEAGDDRFYSGAAADIFDGGEGYDAVYYRSSAFGLTITLGLEDGDIGTCNDGDTLISVERVDGSRFDDVITGSNDDNRLRGLNGDDTLDGLEGNDRLHGNAGNDILYGRSGIDALFGGSGDDTLFGGEDRDRVNGNDGNDEMYGEDGNDILRGGDGDDTIDGGTGADRIFGDSGNDILTGGADADAFFFGGAFGIDTITDFEQGTDVINLTRLREANGDAKIEFDQLLITDTADGARVELDLNRDGIADVFDLDGDSVPDHVAIDLTGLHAADIMATDFQF